MREEKVLIDATICFLVKDDKILLAEKADKIGKGCWNGYGGGIEVGETPEQSCVRELAEEAGAIANVDAMEKMAIVDFHNTKSDGKSFVCRCHVYLIKQWLGEPKETPEMLRPTWFDIDNLPFEKMMLADKIWLPYILAGQKIMAKAYYSPFQQELLGEVSIKEVKELA